MAIKEITVTVPSGESAGRQFVVKRMAAFEADKWARHAIKALTRAGAGLPEDAVKAGVAGLAGLAQTMFGFMDDAAADEALEKLTQCIYVRPDPNNPLVERRLYEIDITDGEMLSFLRGEAFKLNVDFFKAAAYQLSPLVAALLPGQSPEPSPSP